MYIYIYCHDRAGVLVSQATGGSCRVVLTNEESPQPTVIVTSSSSTPGADGPDREISNCHQQLHLIYQVSQLGQQIGS